MKKSNTIWLLVLFGCLLFLPSQALIGHQRLRLKDSITRFESFAFGEGGTIQIDMKYLPAEVPRDLHVTLFVCTERQQVERLTPFWLDQDCKSALARGDLPQLCSVSERLNGTQGPKEFRVAHTGRYRFFLHRCGGTPDQLVDVSYQALNPGGRQLPFGEQPLPTVYLVISVVWFCLFVLCVYRLIDAGSQRNHLHFAMVGMVILKALAVMVYAAYWMKYQSGFRVAMLGYARRVLFGVSEAALLAVLYVASTGWRVTRLTISRSGFRTFLGTLFFLVGVQTFASFYSDDYYFLLLMAMYFFILPKVYSGITKNIRSLETQIWMANNVNLADLPLQAFHRKMRMFRTLRAVVVIYLGTILLVNSLRIVVVWYWDWMNIALHEVIAVTLIIISLHCLRPGAHGVFTDMTELAHLATLQTLIDRSNALHGSDLPVIVPWNTAATLIIQFPSKHSFSSPTTTATIATPESQNNSNPQLHNDQEPSSPPLSGHLCMALLEEVDAAEKFEASQQRRTSS
jgi:hypothetical protein